jgi:SAM-dependent methyltransferase
LPLVSEPATPETNPEAVLEADSHATPETERAGDQFGGYYYRHDCGIPYERNDHWLGFFARIADRIVSDLHPTSVLDAGCAMGFLVEALCKRNVEAWGVDVSNYAISHVHESIREACWSGSLTEPLPRRYDLITCIEVIEHIDPSDTDKVIANLCQATDRLLISTSPFDYAGPTHVNVQPPEVWSGLLAREGFVRDFDYDASYLTPWAALYKRTDEPLSETVLHYDRSWWRLRLEVSNIRGTLLEMQQRLEDAEDVDEIVRLKEEILRLRDQVIGKDAELATALGHVAELEAHNQRYTDLAEHHHRLFGSRSWRLFWAMGKPVRGLKSRLR